MRYRTADKLKNHFNTDIITRLFCFPWTMAEPIFEVVLVNLLQMLWANSGHRNGFFRQFFSILSFFPFVIEYFDCDSCFVFFKVVIPCLPTKGHAPRPQGSMGKLQQLICFDFSLLISVTISVKWTQAGSLRCTVETLGCTHELLVKYPIGWNYNLFGLVGAPFWNSCIPSLFDSVSRQYESQSSWSIWLRI